ncbi:MAG: hypothetical protein NTW86_17615 [Candidatus Sumerlaeota bacterium]|nr:hypothetical protein [Candidatus Sumerlaeota bacterium]
MPDSQPPLSDSPPLLKEKARYADHSARYRWKRAAGYAGLARGNAAFLARAALGRVEWPVLFQPHELDARFFGLNCPPSPTPELEDLVFGAIREIGVRTVRVDWGYESDGLLAARWIERLLGAGIDVLLHLVQPSSDASRMDSRDARGRWIDFLDPIFERFAGRVRCFEIGSTPNRHSWSGYTIRDYVAACRIAQESAAPHAVELAGPNTSDFAPYFTIGLLDACRRAGVRFQAMTDNLFVDRAGAPEAYDPSVAGRVLKNVARLDLVRKEAVLAAIGRTFGIPRAYCTYTSYTLNLGGETRKSRKRPDRYVSPETYADYLARYFTLSAAAGALARVYWGNVAGYYKGLLNDGVRHRPDPPTAHHKYTNLGKADDYERRPALAAFRHVVQRLQGARFLEALSARDPFVFLFQRGETQIAAAWSAKPEGEEAPEVEALLGPRVQAFSRDGEPLDLKAPARLTGSPVYLAW